MPSSFDIYQDVTDTIIAALETGARPWSRSWDLVGNFDMPHRHNGQFYRGINVPILWCANHNAGHTSPYWLTYQQAQEIGGQVRKGEKGTRIVYFSMFEKERDTGKIDKIPFLKTYTAFNACQIDGLAPKFYAKPEPMAPRAPFEAITKADQFVAATGATIDHGGNRAAYSPSHDLIRMPNRDQFHDAQAYYATLLHELTHWTGHASRLDRISTTKRGEVEYAQEELIAELGAAFLCAELRISAEPREDHTAYIASWLRVLKNDKKAIFRAASAAQKAATFLHPTQVEEAEEVAQAA
jgi:antirestriction protein ArdC